MPYSILKKMYQDVSYQSQVYDKCINDHDNYVKCKNEKKECLDLFNIWMNCRKNTINKNENSLPKSN